ncbi:MAG TPA: type III pantothenate kinase [Gammaproteobacteria bacterium]
MNLLVDIGNSRCKWALSIPHAQAELVSFGYLTPDIDLDSQFEHIEKISGAPGQMMVVSVAKTDVTAKLLTALQQRWPALRIRHFTTSARAFGVTNAYAAAETLGADRWAALIGAHSILPANAVIADCGTAVTLDVLTARGAHLGGYILPGLKMMREALHKGTAALPFAAGRGGIGVAQNTHDAIGSGTLLSLIAAIEAVVNAQAEMTHTKVECLLTGGDAEVIGGHLSISYRYEPDLVLKGLAIAIDAEV